MFIAYSELTIDGMGGTRDEAIQEARDNIAYTGITDPEWEAYCDETGTTPTFQTAEATRALVAQVAEEGGAIAFATFSSGLACTEAEFEHAMYVDQHIVRGIFANAPLEADHPTWDWWEFTTDADAAMGNPVMTVGVKMGATADEIAAEIAEKHLRSVDYTADCDDSLEGQTVTILMTAPDGTETQHAAVYQ